MDINRVLGMLGPNEPTPELERLRSIAVDLKELADELMEIVAGLDEDQGDADRN